MKEDERKANLIRCTACLKNKHYTYNRQFKELPRGTDRDPHAGTLTMPLQLWCGHPNCHLYPSGAN